MSSDPMALADEIEHQVGCYRPGDDGLDVNMSRDEWATIIRSLRACPAESAGSVVPAHRFEAAKAEAQERAFRHELAEKTLAAERKRWLRAGRLALQGNLIALRRIVERTENPVPIYGSAALPDQPAGGDDA